jgi:DNA-binding XRE family transcriptional regulator
VFSILYVGQEKLLGKLGAYKEVFWRTLILNMHAEASAWMNFTERQNYLTAVYGEAISPQARERIARKASKPLEMEYYVTEKMEQARAAGKDRLDGEVVKLSIRERREALGLSLQEVADEAGIGKTTAFDIEKGTASKRRNVLEEALANLEEKQAREKINPPQSPFSKGDSSKSQRKAS